MGYQITFTPTEEQMKDYKPWNESKERSYENMSKNGITELIHYCMKDHAEDSTSTIIKQIEFNLRFIAKTVEQQEKEDAYFRWKDDENHELWYCGWEFSKDYPDLDLDELIRVTLEDLAMLADIVTTPDWFEDNEKFYKKWDFVKESINSFYDSAQDIAIHGIIRDLKAKGAEKVYLDKEINDEDFNQEESENDN